MSDIQVITVPGKISMDERVRYDCRMGNFMKEKRALMQNDKEESDKATAGTRQLLLREFKRKFL